MPRPKTKSELIELSQANFRRLNAHIDALSASEQLAEFRPGTMNRNIRDVLAHLHEWHLMLLDWYAVGMAGHKPTMPAKGYTWKTLPALNQAIWQRNRDTPLTDTRTHLQQSFNAIQQIINRHTDTELFAKKHFTWTGSTSLGAYLVSATSSHYDWALKLIKKASRPS